MILKPEEIQQRFGKLFTQKILVMIDEKNQYAEIVEKGIVRGTVEWEVVNRCRAGGVVEWCKAVGHTVITRAKLGESPVQFGPADMEHGGQALEGILVDGDNVKIKWAGIGGAGLGVAVSLAQAPGVISASYPHEDDLLKVGGARTNRVTITTPCYEKIIIGIDDTDNKEGGATWLLALKAVQAVSNLDGIEFLDLRLNQLWPKAPQKTTNCVSSGLIFAVRPNMVNKLIQAITDFVKAETRSEDTGLVVYRGINIPVALNDFGWEVKKRLVLITETDVFVDNSIVSIIMGRGKKGLIGAIASIGLSEEGIETAALCGDKSLELMKKCVGKHNCCR